MNLHFIDLITISQQQIYLSQMKSCLFLFLSVILLCSVNANLHLNVKYREVIQGRQALTYDIIRDIYSDFKSRFDEKSAYRFNIFKARLESIVKHNSAKSTFRRGITSFSDMTFEEFKQSRLMAPQECSATYNLRVSPALKSRAIPSSFDWVNYGVITPVKDQGNCGSCWTFSTVGTLEGFWNILHKGKDVFFSEQQLVDCAGDYNNFGCEGGLPSQAFEYIKNAGGIETNLTYPYTAKDQSCSFRPNIAVGYVKHGSYNITRGDEVEMAERVWSAGPIAVSFQVIDDFVDYVDGVYTSNSCGTTTDDVNHAVTLTGYGEESGIKFWNIKNSWSTDWGNQGYFKIERGRNMCAVSQCNSYPLIDNISGLEPVNPTIAQV